MLKKIISIFTVLSVFLALLAFSPVLAKNNKNTEEFTPPEIDGTYDVPGHPEMKVRVFVHKGKPSPESVPAPALTCPADPVSLALVSKAGWHLPEGDWTYRLNISSAPSSFRGSFAEFTKRSFAEWQGKTELNGKVAFVPGANTTVNRARYDGQNIIAWGKISASALAIAYTWYYPSTGLVAENDTIMNNKFAWSWTDQTQNPTTDVAVACADQYTYDAQNILTHELGHWVGLNDHYTGDYIDNTMYGYGSKGEAKKDTLTAGDIAGVNAIY